MVVRFWHLEGLRDVGVHANTRDYFWSTHGVAYDTMGGPEVVTSVGMHTHIS